ncbi:RNA polymerase sigma factor [Roseibium denhamense]|uniref:RNA polymerase sigma-70 factor, ECF subfamily n=1 Tax=Roseibium denhamense TaxID=76305 RepID=A0ABY1NTP3_9HYPH|nr:RNA polymerase sigma factor [Roseibium denhamense]MTI05339.1 RNA polymerase sigma factor [Roseibium denhamense]SMP17227.1 RNA polymerase sigma-70 factor, ECF subfamily [Roseibium denhamense]
MGNIRQEKVRALEALLVLDAKAGDKTALGKLVDLRGPRLFAHAVRLSGDRDAARDIVQEAWIQIIRGLPGLNDETAFLPWALCIVSRRVSAVIRTRQTERKLAEQLAPEAVSAQEPGVDMVLDAAAVRRAIKCLPPAQEATVALFYLEDLSVAEVAKALDIPIGTVKTRLMAARAALRDILEGHHDG